MATGKIKDDCVYVVRKGSSYTQHYHYTFLELLEGYRQIPELTVLSPEERNACYAKAFEKWEEEGKAESWQFSLLWQYIAYEVAKVQRDHDASTQRGS